jgi:tetratricopeptide (TPR) repeat protein
MDGALGGARNIPSLSGSSVSSRSKVPRAAAVVALAAAMLAAGAVGALRSPSPAGTSSLGLSENPAAAPVALTGGLAGSIPALQQRLRAAPTDWRLWAFLALAYVQEARVTSDPSYYAKADGTLRRSLDLNPTSFEASIAHGALALARHRFGAALLWGRRAREANPYSGNAYGIIGDAQLELGRYPKAFAALQRMVDLDPNVASYTRGSYVRELQGDTRGAIAIMKLALDAAATPQDRAFAAHHLGELFWNSGRPKEAARWYRLARDLAPEYAPPLAGLAKVAWFKGRTGDAIRRYRRVVAITPMPEYAIALGDLYAQTGRRSLAAGQYALVRTEQRLFRAAGVNVDLELALFDADHGRHRHALAAARSEWRRRRSIHAADAVAWALYRNGRYEQASRRARLALRLGSRNALFHFHAGMIDVARDRTSAARAHLSTALAINPSFSIRYAGTAARALTRLGGAT